MRKESSCAGTEKLSGRDSFAAATLSIAVLAGVVLLFVVAERASFAGQWDPVHSGDHLVFPAMARYPVLSKEFYTSLRPFTVPLLYKVLRADEPSVVQFQSWLSVLCWISLAVVIARESKRFIFRVAALGLICLFSLSIPINQWDRVIKSESVSFSLLALWLALTVLVTRSLLGRTRLGVPLVLGWMVSSLLFSSARVSNLLMLVLLGLAFGVWFIAYWCVAVRKGWSPVLHRGLLVCLVCLGAVVGFGIWSNTQSLRWYTPLVNVVLRRVLSDRGTYDHWVEQYSFPRNEVFEEFSGLSAWDVTADGSEIRERLRDDPELADVMSWLTERGVVSYGQYLLWDSLWQSVQSASEALAEYTNMFNERYGGGAGETVWTAALSDWMYPPIRAPLALGAVLFVGGCVAVVASPSARVLGLLTAFTVANSWAQAFLNFHGDAGGVERHMHISGLLLRLALVFAVLIVVLMASQVKRKGHAVGRGSGAPAPD